MKILKPIVKILGLALLALFGLTLLVVIVFALVFNWVDKSNGEIESSSERREYLLYVPDTYDASTPTPLVISIHGFADWPAHQMAMTGWNSLADEHGFIVVYPSGMGFFPKRWRAGGSWNTLEDIWIDVKFISDLIDHFSVEYNIDSKRIYANGLSNGGGMSHVLACLLSERIAAIGGVAGAYGLPDRDCNPARSVPVIAFHGTADNIVPYDGGLSGPSDSPFPAVPDWAAAWADRNGCVADTAELPASGEVSGVRYTGCDQGAEVLFYTVHGGGHTWPGGVPLPEWITGPTSMDIDATALMWEFFSRYSLPGGR